MAPKPAAPATGWTVQAAVDPAKATGAQLFAVSCSAATRCVAVGGYSRAGAGEAALAELWDGSAWRLEPAPLPAGALQSYLSGVACGSATSCEAVGQYENSAARHRPLAEHWNGARWAIVAAPSPVGATQAELSGVGCVSSAQCVAVGDDGDAAGGDVPLAERWDGTRWSLMRIAAPSGSEASALAAVACSGAAACTAVGQVEAATGATSPLAERWNGTTWARQVMPAPAGGVTVDAVACPSATRCVAVGDRAVNPTTLVEAWDGHSWVVTTVPAPGGNTGAFLLGVSCPATTWCVATGAFLGAAGTRWSLAYAWDGTGWTRETTRNPGRRFTSLDAVSCSAAHACTAVGDDEGTGGVTAPLAERSPG